MVMYIFPIRQSIYLQINLIHLKSRKNANCFRESNKTIPIHICFFFQYQNKYEGKKVREESDEAWKQ